MNKKIISIDTIILFLATLSTIRFVPAKLRLFIYSIVLLLVGLYILIDLSKNTSDKGNEYFPYYKFIIALLIIFFVAVLPCIHRIGERHNGKPYEFAHDGGVIQTEEAIKYFIKGKNPYHEDYYNTVLDEHYTVYKLDEIKNSLIHHYTYLPLTFIFPLPFYIISKAAIGWFDMRFIYILMFVLSLYIVTRLNQSTENKILLLITFSLNPFFTYFIADGRNEVFLLFWIILTLFFLINKSFRTASVFLAFACVSKLTAWFLVPFFMVYIFGKNNNSESLKHKIISLLKNIYPFILILLMFLLPFLIWDFSSFIEDVFNWDKTYPLGGTPGFGFANFLLFIGYSRADYFPFKYLQLVIGLPVLYYLLKKQVKNNTTDSMLINYGILTFVLFYFARFFHDNYIGYILSILYLGFFLEQKEIDR